MYQVASLDITTLGLITFLTDWSKLVVIRTFIHTEHVVCVVLETYMTCEVILIHLFHSSIHTRIIVSSNPFLSNHMNQTCFDQFRVYDTLKILLLYWSVPSSIC